MPRKTNPLIEPKKRTCDICGYTWWSQSEAKHISCPRCGGKTDHARRRTVREEDKE